MKKILILVCTISFLFLYSCSNISDEIKDTTPSDTMLESNTEAISTQDTVHESAPTNDPQTTSSSDETEPQAIGGGDVLCPIHTLYYHAFPDEVINYIGETEYREWMSSRQTIRDENGCYTEATIYKAVEYFNIPNEVLIEAYQNDFYNCDWDMESLLVRDEASFDRISRELKSNPEYSNYHTKLINERSLKYALFTIMESKTDTQTVNYYNLVSENGKTIPVTDISIIEIIENTSITKEDFETAMNWATDQATASHFEYDLDLLFGDASLMTNAINELDVPYYESRVKMSDALLHVGEKK